MRGSPPLHLLLALLGFALFAIPLARLTFARPEVQHPASENAEPIAKPGQMKCHITIHALPVPASLSLKAGGTETVNGLPAALSSAMEFDTELPIAHDTLELLVGATWPQGTGNAAITIDIEPDGHDSQSQTRWASGAELAEVLTFKWQP